MLSASHLASLLYNYVLEAVLSHVHRQEYFMVALKSSRLGALLVAFALLMSFFGALQLLTTRTASATALACPAPTTNVNNKVDLDWDNLQLVNPQGAGSEDNREPVGCRRQAAVEDERCREGRRLLHLRRNRCRGEHGAADPAPHRRAFL